MRSAWAAKISTMEPRVLLAAAFTEFVDPNAAAGNQFGQTVVVLNTGNVVITSPFDDAGGQDAGAVYLFNGADGTLISTLTGSQANDNLGSDGVAALANGNFVVASSRWDNGAIVDAGAVTWGNGVTGINGTVSLANSVIGSTANDLVGQAFVGFNGEMVHAVTGLANGNYVIASPFWDNGGIIDAGAATWVNGATGGTGTLNDGNSLVGATAGDGVGGDLNGGLGVTELTNGNYVVLSGGWSNGANAFAGAVTWGNGTTGIVGTVSAANSLVGTNAGDGVGTDQNGDNSITALTNGNYVVSSPSWMNGAIAQAGAVTWGNGVTGITGAVSLANSVVGSTANDQVGSAFNGESGVAALTNGNYVISSSYWDNGGIVDAGAATWVNGATGGTGTLNNGNSLVGTTAMDFVGAFAATPLTNGNYVIASTAWNNGGVAQAGAVTWGNGATGINGNVSVANSLVGTSTNDAVGFVDNFGNGVQALANGNYVVASSLWDNGAIANVGAVTWADGSTGLVGAVSAANSLIGSIANDMVGGTEAPTLSSVTPLTNGNYVVSSIYWDLPGVLDAGAATFGNGATGTVGVVSPANSLVGTTPRDYVGAQVIPLANGNYVVASPVWNNGAATSAGAVAIGNGLTGTTGPVTAANSLIGSTTDDNVGFGNSQTALDGVTPLANGNYVVVSPAFTNAANANAGAMTFGSGNLGVTGTINSFNSVAGLAANTGLVAPIVVDDVNGNFYGQFVDEGNGKVRVGSQASGFANVAPTFPNQVLMLAENSVAGTIVPYTVATDTDAGQTLTYAITAGNTKNAFAIDAMTGQITVNNPDALDFENEPPFDLTVTATDNGNPVLSTAASIRIFLTNVNDAPNVYNHTISLAENTPAGTNILNYSLIASDQDAGQTLTYAITAGNTKNAFAIDAATGQITVSNSLALDFDNEAPFVLTISVTDNGNPVLTSSANLGILLTDVNDAPNVYNHTISLVENSAAGTNVFDYSIIASDQDAGQTLSYAITAGNTANAFAIDAATGQITVNNSDALDFENMPPFVLTIAVTDNGNPALTSSAKLGIKLTDVNDAPRLYNHTITLAENTPNGSNVFNYSLIPSEQDAGQTLTYAITAGNSKNAFAIDAATGQITVNNAAALDFENEPPFVLTISVTDSGNPALTTSAKLGIQLTDVNDAPVLYNHAVTIPENSAAGTNVLNYSLIASDQDFGQTRTYAITAGNRNNTFAIDTTTGQITVANPAGLDFENEPFYDLTIQVSDNGNPAASSTASLKVFMSNVNDAPLLYNASVNLAENSAVGTSILDYSTVAFDQDPGQTLTYAITAGNTNNAFKIDAATGLITVNTQSALDIAVTPKFDLTISVTDNGNPALTSTATLTVNLTDVNKPPVLDAKTYAVKTGAVAGTVVGTLTSTDPDGGGAPSYTNVSSNGILRDAFVVNPTTGVITITKSFLFVPPGTYDLSIRVADNLDPTLFSVGTVKVQVNATGVVVP